MPHQKLEALRSELLKIAPTKKIAIAFSGGLDSRFLAFAAQFLGFEVFLIHVNGPHISAEETENAKRWAEEHGFIFQLVKLNPLQRKEVSLNTRERCYWCKKEIFEKLSALTKEPLCDGTNHSDLSQYRPGLRALQELGIHSPLADSKISKQDIRQIGKLIGLDNVDQPSQPCILTRFPYDQIINDREIDAVNQAEDAIKTYLTDKGLGSINFRLRKTISPKFTLHILESDFNNLNPSHITALLRLLKDIDADFSELEIKPLNRLSGYFDRK